ncbi:hypothetical protein LMG27174_07215 [Paraburkholderia rhynchosiae]|uniref:Uncharacterized protein n=1 Tax=Paraburkholderia rhynchosiae TaxID=487049 RepID=A0A6J5CUX4_9BURK|nr:hypothetical protein LMG27174_07215 [Paraburkholderia rhynchosiae]
MIFNSSCVSERRFLADHCLMQSAYAPRPSHGCDRQHATRSCHSGQSGLNGRFQGGTAVVTSGIVAPGSEKWVFVARPPILYWFTYPTFGPQAVTRQLHSNHNYGRLGLTAGVVLRC